MTACQLANGAAMALDEVPVDPLPVFAPWLWKKWWAARASPPCFPCGARVNRIAPLSNKSFNLSYCRFDL